MFNFKRATCKIAVLCTAALAIAVPSVMTSPAAANPNLTPGVWTNITPAAANLGSGGPGYFPEGITVDPSNPNNLYFCVCGYNADFSALPGGVWKSTDGGSNWTDLTQLDQPVHVRIDPNNGNHLYAVDGVRGNTTGFWISNNGGTTWTEPANFVALVNTLTSQGFPNFNDLYTVDTEPGNFNHILISSHSCDNTIGESFDGGTTWVAHRGPAAYCSGGYAIFFLYNKTHTIGNAQTWLLTTQTDGFYRTTNSGASWTKVTTTSMVHGGEQIYYAGNGTLFAGAWAVSGPIRSTDNGITWQNAGTGAQNSTMGLIGDGTTIYTSRAWGTGPFYTSPENDGVTWTAFNGGSQTYACGSFEMGYDAVNGIVYASMTENGRPGSTQDGIYALKVSGTGSAPSAPTGLAATAGSAQVTLTWNASGGATAYDVKRSTVSGSGYVTVSSPTATNYTNTGLTNGTTYYFVVDAKNSFGTSVNSGQASATPTGSVPPVPTGLTATAGSAQVALSWNASATATAYDVKRSTVSGSGYVTVSSPTATSYTNTGLTNGTAYYFVVAAKNAVGSSANSAQASATPVAPTQAQIPNGTVTIDGNVDAAWSGAASYNITNPSGTISSGADLSASWQGLWDATNLYILVSITDDVKNNDSTNPWDDDAVEIYLDADHNGGTSYDANDRQIICGWGDASPVEGGGRAISGAAFGKADPTGTTYRIEAKIPWAVEAFTPSANAIIGVDVHVDDDDDGAGRDGKLMWNDTTDGAWGNPSLFGTGKLLAASGPPPVPTGLTATPGNAQVALSWAASSGATSYNVSRSTVSGSGYASVATGISTTSYTNTGLTNGTAYYFVVSATNASGTSANSSQASATPTAGGSGSIISIDLVGGNAGVPSAMGAGESAGVVAATNWNSAAGASGSGLALKYSTGSASGATFAWSGVGTWLTSITETAGNNRMMDGYLDDSSGGTSTATVSGIPSSLTTSGYDVYVYSDLAGGGQNGNYTIGGTTIGCNHPGGAVFNGTFTQANNSNGNYVKFTNVNAASFTLSATPAAGFSRAPINGIQIVGH